MLIKTIKEYSITAILFFMLLAIAMFSYWPGMQGLFIFDDMPNISPLGKYKDFSLWDNFLLFVLEGDSGPIGRPISLASFYLNDTAWPSQPASFTFTNILIHLLNGSLVFWFVYKLGDTLKLTPTQQIIFPLFSMSLWILHPLHTTTVLYIVQRMTELSALFTLAGLIFYLYGREKIESRPVAGLLLLFLGVGSSLLLSLLSKENGILLVAYILTIEFFLLQPLNKYSSRLFYYWLTPAVIIPFTLILFYLGHRVWLGSGFENRNFSLTERLLTEPRIIFDYLHHIILPRVGDMSILHDDYVISRSLLTPWTTLPSIFGVVALVVLAVIWRKKQPLIAFAIAWFFMGHLLESTVLPLELYFEHRNYLPMLGFFISISWYFNKLFQSHRFYAVALVTAQIILFSFLLIQNTSLWSKPVELIANWYQAHPNSMRTQEAYLKVMKPYGVTEKDLSNKQPLNQVLPPYMKLLKLSQACKANTATVESLNSSVEALSKYAIHATASTALTSFISEWLDGSCENITSKEIESFLLELAELENTKNNSIFGNYVHYWLSEIYRNKHDFGNTMKHIDKAYSLSPDMELLKLRAVYLSSAGLHQEALRTLDDTTLLEKGFKAKLALSIKQKDLDGLKETITTKIATPE